VKSNTHKIVGRRLAWICSAGILVISLAQASAQQKAKEAVDSIAVQADAIPLPGLPPKAIALRDKMSWSDLYNNWKLGSLQNLPWCVTPTAAKEDGDKAYIFHIAHWANGKPPRLISSSWSAYGSKWHHPDVLERRLTTKGDPLVYGKKKVLLVGVDVFDDANNGASTLTIRYKSSVTQGTPENVDALGQLVTSVLGLTSAAKAAAGSVLIAFDCQAGTDHLPFDLNVVETIGLPQAPDGNAQDQNPVQTQSPDTLAATNQDNGQQAETAPSSTGQSPAGGSGRMRATQPLTSSPSDSSNSSQTNDPKTGGQNTPQPGQADCSALSSKSNCTVSRTFTSLDQEWWDVSLGVTIPGVRESTYSISKGMLQSKPTTHTDLYALFDIYPGAKLVTKSSFWPHFTAGLPVTGRVFYRPEFGISENLTGWNGLEKRGFPVPMSFFVGLVDMKTTSIRGTPTTATQLAADSVTRRVLKPIFGIEVPVSSLISKVGKSSKSQNTNSTTPANTKGGKQGSTAATTP
jgi:hypothetical protein